MSRARLFSLYLTYLVTQSGISVSDPRASSEEYAMNKVFVGGLHYDTRDGTGSFLIERQYITDNYLL